MTETNTRDPFEEALIGAVFAQIARDGWWRLSIARAAGEAGLDMARARRLLPSRTSFLLRFGAQADQAALSERPESGTAQERLFDAIMRRLDVFQRHRAGLVVLLRALPTDPAAGALLAAASLVSMGWLLEAAGISATGPMGMLRRKGLLAVWLWTLRAWLRDETADMASTMAALDTALARAAQVARSLPGETPSAPADDAPAEAQPD